MTPSSSSPLGRSTKPRAYRPPRPGGPVEPALTRNGLHQCDCPGCGRGRHGLGRWCKPHAYTYSRTGHPVALTIPRREFAPFVKSAEAFVLAHLRADHLSIEAGLRWIAGELANAERPTNHKRVHLAYEDALLRAKRSGVSPTELLARFIAGELADDRGEPRPRYASDRHAAHQRARLFLLTTPFGKQGWSRRKRELQAPREITRVTFGVREYAHQRINAALGLLALRASAAIQQRGQ